ncbi:hypothetical protein [Stenotrophomonas maltophilia]|uniref:hypothetical protein n=1 Tax=Stenotrophomonas maltophilia TaxID=40324 RepID=UPI0034DB7267
MFADNGGYCIGAGHVNLVGGAIASTHAGNSELTAGSQTFTDLQNHMDYTANSGKWVMDGDGQFKTIVNASSGLNVNEEELGRLAIRMAPKFDSGLLI